MAMLPAEVARFDIENYDLMCGKILQGGLNGKRIDLVLSCVDNYAARMAINRVIKK